MAECGAIKRFTEAEYNDYEERSEVKNQYVDGRIFAMTEFSGRHIAITGAVGVSLHTQLRNSKCMALMSRQRVKVEATGMQTYPDVLVACPPLRYDPSAGEGLVLLDATVLVEILSPSTAEYDRGAKFLDYQQLPSLRHYVLISQDRVTVEHRWRARWRLEDRSADHARQIRAPEHNQLHARSGRHLRRARHRPRAVTAAPGSRAGLSAHATLPRSSQVLARAPHRPPAAYKYLSPALRCTSNSSA